MKITVFTSNQSRHLYLIDKLSEVGDVIYAIQESRSVFINSSRRTSIMQKYFRKVDMAQKTYFGDIHFLKSNVRQLVMQGGDLSLLSLDVMNEALHSDLYVVFGASYIKGSLVDFLVDHGAINIHMGVCPYYRGSDCNFWAAYDGHPEFIGATIHKLSRGLDSGSILYHALPKKGGEDSFMMGMRAVKIAHDSLAEKISDGEIFDSQPVQQDKLKQIRYSRMNEFTDEVAEYYMNHMPDSIEIERKLESRDMTDLVKAYVK